MPTVKRCPKCNGKCVPLQKMALLEKGRNSLKYLETYQPYRCKRCKLEWRVPIKKGKTIIRMGDFI